MTDMLNLCNRVDGRWDVCLVVQTFAETALLLPIDRVDPHRYVYSHISTTGAGARAALCEWMVTKRPRHAQWVPFSAGRIAPYLSRVTVPAPSDARAYDLVDVQGPDGQWQVAEVCSNIANALWILIVDHYESFEQRESQREWINVDDPRLAPYRSHPQPHLALGTAVRLPPAAQTMHLTDICGYRGWLDAAHSAPLSLLDPIKP